MEWLRLGTLSVGSLTTTILLGMITGYLLSLRGKRRDTWCLAGYLGTLFVLLLSYTVRYSLFSPVSLATGQVSNLIVFGLVCLIQFAYHYGENHHPRESRIALYVSLGLSAVIWGSLFLDRGQAVYDFQAEYFTYEYGPRISILTLAGYCWALSVLVRKVVRASRHSERAAGGEAAARGAALRALVQPRGRTAVSCRSFALLTVAQIVLALLYMFYQTGVITRATYSLVFNTGSLVICMLIFVVYINNAPQPTSYLTKLVGLPLVVVMVAVGMSATALMPIVHGALADRYRSEVDQAWAAVLNGDVKGISPNVAFLQPVPPGFGRLTYHDPYTAGVKEALLAGTRGVRGLLPERRGLAPGFFYLDLRDTGSFYFYHTLSGGEGTYRVGFHYGEYRLAVHRVASRFALVVLLASLLVVFGFPVAFRRGLLKPLGGLLEAVREVSAGNYGMSVPVLSEDEIGQLARGYNHMAEWLRNAEGNFKALAENANDAILILSADGRFLYVNQRAAEISGYSPARLRQMRFGDLVHPEELEEVSRRLARRMARAPAPRCYETRVVRRDGEVIPVEITGAWTVWQDSPADAVIIRDISQRRQAEETMRAQQQQLLRADKLASLGALVAGVAHEVNNPNQVMAMDARFLSEALAGLFALAESGEEADEAVRLAGMPYPRFREAVRAAVSEIEDSTARIEHIVGELKRFAGGVRRAGQPTDVNGVVKTVVELSRHAITRATRRFALELEEGIPEVDADRVELEQVVLNLLLNACQALPEPGCGMTLSTSWDRQEEAACIEVRDEGVGIAESDLARITEPFFTTRGDSGGTGLGLSVSSRIVRRHGGSLRFTSQVGRGTTATVRLPLKGRGRSPAAGRQDGA